MQHELKSVSDLLGSASAEQVEQFLDMLSDNALLSLPYLFEHWAHRTHQLPPVGDWTTWVVLGGRGAGKTRTGAEWIRSRLEGATTTEPGLGRRAALVAETQDQAREVMVFGDSGILACSPPDRRPEWVASKRKLVWPNGSEAQCFSASDPEGLRGPQFDTAWCDELAKWKKAEPAWDMLQFCMRLGQDPRTVVTTTPRSTRMLRALLDEKTTVKTSAPTEANKLYLAESFLEKITAKSRTTRLGRQELNGELLTDTDGALRALDMLEAARVDEAPEMDRILHAARLGPKERARLTDQPFGTLGTDGAQVYAHHPAGPLAWSFNGYTPVRAPDTLTILTPEPIRAALSAGYAPQWHPSAPGS